MAEGTDVAVDGIVLVCVGVEVRVGVAVRVEDGVKVRVAVLVRVGEGVETGVVVLVRVGTAVAVGFDEPLANSIGRYIVLPPAAVTFCAKASGMTLLLKVIV